VRALRRKEVALMKRIMLLVTVVFVMAAMMVVLAGTAMAHTEGDPCAAAVAGPGNSGYADHHVLPLVGGQGGTQHNPGEHQGFSPCVP
jgi:hypothetical protein